MSINFRGRAAVAAAVFGMTALAQACRPTAPTDRVRASGQVEATEVQVGAPVAGRLLTLRVSEGDRVQAGDAVALLDSADSALSLRRVRADRDQALAQLQLLLAGARPQEIRQAEAQLANAEADVRALDAELASAQADAERFEALLASNSGSRKQRDDAVTRRDVAAQHLRGAQDRVRAASENLARFKAGARREDVDAARARVASVEAQMATWEKTVADATVTAPIGGVVTEKVADVGELLQPRVAIVTISDLDHAWANVYVAEPLVPRLKVGQSAVVFTDAGGAGLPGTVTYVSPKAEFTPRNVQTAEDRSKLVYRVKVTVDNRQGTLKSGMPVEAEIPLGR